MILPQQKDAAHRIWLYRILTAICDNQHLVAVLCFKGGTCAAMLGWLNRFSIDLDFDYIGKPSELPQTRKELELIFVQLGLTIKDQSKQVPQYFLKYSTNDEQKRNTVKIDITMPPPQANQYEQIMLTDIDRIMNCQTIDTMFANKLVALIDRYEKNGTLAGRDLYDINHFFINNFPYDTAVIIERRKNKNLKQFFLSLIKLIQEQTNDKIINQDINTLLSVQEFQSIRKTLRQEVIGFLQNEAEKY
jgi:predicted nucleotidyltransferase component of viral defense system